MFWSGSAWKTVSPTNPLPTTTSGPGTSVQNPTFVHNVLRDKSTGTYVRSLAGFVMNDGEINAGITATVPHNYCSSVVVDGELPSFGNMKPVQGDAVFNINTNLNTAVTAVRSMGVDPNIGNYQVDQHELTRINGIEPVDGKLPAIAYAATVTNPQTVSTPNVYRPLTMAYVDTNDSKKGFAVVTQLAESTNAGQYLPGSSQKTFMVRSNAAADGLSQQLCTTNLDAVAVKNETGGVLKMAGYSSDGKTSWDRPDGSIVPSGDISRIASTAVMTTTQLVGPLGVTRCQLVDGDNVALSVVNGVLSATLSDTQSHPLQVNTHTVGTSSSYVLAVENSAPADGTLGVDIVDPVLEWLQGKSLVESKDREVWQQCIAHYKRDPKTFVAKAQSMKLPLDQIPNELRKFFEKGASSPSG